MARFNRDRLAMIGVFAVALAARASFWAYEGTIVGNDDYTAVCSVWFSDPLGVLFAHKGILYAGFTFPFCLVRAIPGTTQTTWIIIQITLSALAAVLLYRVGKQLVDFKTGLFAGLGLAVLWDTFFWSTAVLSDSIATVVVVVALWALVRHHTDPSITNRLIAFVALGYLVVSRPHGIAIVLGWIAFELYSQEDKRLNLFGTRILPAAVFAAIPLGIPAILERYNLYSKWREGWIIVHDKSLFVYDVPTGDPGMLQWLLENIHHMVAMGILKMAFFFVPFLPRHSMAHILVNAVTYLPIYVLGFVGIIHARRNHYPLYRLCIGPVITMLLVTAITFVSYDLRYRAPMGPLFALAFGYFVSTLNFDLTSVWRSLTGKMR